MNNLYTKKALDLYDEAKDICSKIYNPDKGCIVCKYIRSDRCKVSCLEEEYNVLDLKNLQQLDVNDYVDNHNTCNLPNKICNESEKANCAICLLEMLLRDKNIKFIKKEIYNGK